MVFLRDKFFLLLLSSPLFSFGKTKRFMTIHGSVHGRWIFKIWSDSSGAWEQNCNKRISFKGRRNRFCRVTRIEYMRVREKKKMTVCLATFRSWSRGTFDPETLLSFVGSETVLKRKNLISSLKIIPKIDTFLFLHFNSLKCWIEKENKNVSINISVKFALEPFLLFLSSSSSSDRIHFFCIQSLE